MHTSLHIDCILIFNTQYKKSVIDIHYVYLLQIYTIKFLVPAVNIRTQAFIKYQMLDLSNA